MPACTYTCYNYKINFTGRIAFQISESRLVLISVKSQDSKDLFQLLKNTMLSSTWVQKILYIFLLLWAMATASYQSWALLCEIILAPMQPQNSFSHAKFNAHRNQGILNVNFIAFDAANKTKLAPTPIQKIQY